MKHVRGGLFDYQLAVLAMLTGQTLKKVRTAASKVTGSKEWYDLRTFGSDNNRPDDFWRAVILVGRSYGLERAWLENLWQAVTDHSEEVGCYEEVLPTSYPPKLDLKGRGQITFWSAHGSHAVAYENGEVYDPAKKRGPVPFVRWWRRNGAFVHRLFIHPLEGQSYTLTLRWVRTQGPS